ncbi:MAG: aminoglycoside phosphotransferase family protein [Bacteroidota bacterium]
MLHTILQAYGIVGSEVAIKPFGNGLINHTWTVNSGTKTFILQRINHNVFKNPADIASNIRNIGDYITKNCPGYLFVSTIKTLQQQDLVFKEGEGYFRLFPFVENSHTIDVVTAPEQGYEAAKQFGKFTKILSSFPAEKLHTPLANFHNLPLRYQQFENAIISGNKKRINAAADSIKFLQQQYAIVTTSENIPTNSAFKKRVTHHDTKISNVLFDHNDKGLCVIDLDTVMPGYFISDVGDMLRTYLSPVSEEEPNFDKIEIRDDYFKAIAEGYMLEMNDELTLTEKNHFVYAGKFMIYMQALRFLTDYINDDVYYGAKYEGHNLVRGKNQAVLLQKLIEKEKRLSEIIR